MIFGFEKAQLDLDSDKVREMSRKLCRFMMKDERFLDFRPSQIAAASLLLAVNLNQSGVSSSRIFKQTPDLSSQKSMPYGDTTGLELGGQISGRRRTIMPFSLWDKAVEDLTGLNRQNDIKPIYKSLLQQLQQSESQIGKMMVMDQVLSPTPNLKIRA